VHNVGVGREGLVARQPAGGAEVDGLGTDDDDDGVEVRSKCVEAIQQDPAGLNVLDAGRLLRPPAVEQLRADGRAVFGVAPERPGTILYFFWGPGAALAEETDGAGNTLVRYACSASGAALAQQSYRIVDGAVVEQKAFDPYGAPQAAGSSTTDPMPPASSPTLVPAAAPPGWPGSAASCRSSLGPAPPDQGRRSARPG
jgi:hypothetical protein